jgi:hypothetical protein
MTKRSERRAFLRLSAAAAAGFTLACSRLSRGAGGKRKVLLVYFSRAGENYFNGGRKVLEVGNTEVVAGFIRDALRCDVFEIHAVQPYSDRYDPTVQRNVREQEQNARPGIVDLPASNRRVRHRRDRQPDLERARSADHAHVRRALRLHRQDGLPVHDPCDEWTRARRRGVQEGVPGSDDRQGGHDPRRRSSEQSPRGRSVVAPHRVARVALNAEQPPLLVATCRSSNTPCAW